jgi:non-specific serine/threonine protein kinase/serine/threonine-protein kinase
MPDGPRDPVPSNDEEATREPAPSSQPAGQIGPYRLLQRVGEGGMGEVWLAEQTHPVRRQVALKIIKAGMDSAQVVARFEAERQALALMDHPAIARVFDAGTTPQGRPYFAMEYVKGEPITAYCDRHRLTTPERLDLFIHVCEGVQHAHQKGIIHRDLKPSNVLVTIQDDHPVPKIIDFGVAKATAQPLTQRTLYTELGVMIGTPEYMSPEQAEMGGLDIDTRTDVYALGVMLYELLTGVLPFDREELRRVGFMEIQRTIREKEPLRPSTRVTHLGPASTEAAHRRHTEPARLAGELRGDLDWITMRALEKDRTRRYDTVIGLANDVRRHMKNEPVVASPPSTTYRVKKFVRRHRFGVAAAATVGVLLIGFAATMAVQAQRIARERDRANREAETAKQVSAFLVGLFKVPNPSESRGNAFTAREVLDKGAMKVEKDLSARPEIQSRLANTMANSYAGLGLYNQAQHMYEQAVDSERRSHGRNSVEALNALANLCGNLVQQEKVAEAEAACREAVDGLRRLGGPDQDETISVVGQLAILLYVQGKVAEAEPLFRQVAESRRRQFGRGHARTLSAVNNLAAALHTEGKLVEAERTYRELVDESRASLGANHPYTIVFLCNLSELLEEQGKAAEAAPYAREALANARKVLPPTHKDLGTALVQVGSVVSDQGRYAEAESYLREAVSVFTKTEGDRWRLAWAQSALGQSLAGQRRLDAAEPLLLDGYQGVWQSDAATPAQKQQALRRVIQLYDVWGKPEKAAEWREKLADATAKKAR